MASSKDYLQFILEQLSDLEEITYRAMMGEYILYYCGKIVGGIYDDRLLVKPIKSAVSEEDEILKNFSCGQPNFTLSLTHICFFLN